MVDQSARVFVVGSSPLARGLLETFAKREDLIRIIPARAGFTPPDETGSATLRDHPRSRGVYELRKVVEIVGPGSSPLARGLR